uniref:Uncharacterized protein n=1 Tax=Steinernema glaseri TaxID=37863 RepID=A0A1I7ZEH6_9BILA
MMSNFLVLFRTDDERRASREHLRRAPAPCRHVETEETSTKGKKRKVWDPEKIQEDPVHQVHRRYPDLPCFHKSF